LQVTTGCLRDQLVIIFKQGRRQFAEAFAISEYQKDAFIQDKNLFFEWLLCENKEIIPEKTQVNSSKTVGEHCQQYEWYVWFKMGKLMWVRHRTMFDKNICYLKNKIIKPYDMAVRDFNDQVVKVYSYLYYMQPPSMNNQAWYQAKWNAM
jgi:hypothetical protein